MAESTNNPGGQTLNERLRRAAEMARQRSGEPVPPAAPQVPETPKAPQTPTPASATPEPPEGPEAPVLRG